MTQPLNRNKTYIQDILNAIQLCFSFTQEMTFESFEKDLKTISAVQHQILIIGEATKRLTQEFRNQHPHIPWKAMAGMRDILIHSYENADIEEIWKTVQNVMPNLNKELSSL